MKILCLLLLAAVSAFSQTYAYVSPSADISSCVGNCFSGGYPSAAPYTGLTDIRIDFRLVNIDGTCTSSSISTWFSSSTVYTHPTTGVITGIGLFDLGCQDSTTLRYSFAANSGTISMAAWGSPTSLLGRFERLHGDRYNLYFWKLDGTQLPSAGTPAASFVATGGGQAVVASAVQRLAQIVVKGRGDVDFAWIRAYTTIAGYSTMPRDTPPEDGALFAYEFENNLNDSSGNGATLTRSSGSASYVFIDDTSSPPAYQARALTTGVSGQVQLLNNSFRYSNSNPFTTIWKCVSCPQEPRWGSGRRSGSVTLSGLLPGVYTFEALIDQTEAKQTTVTVENLDSEGLHILPTNLPEVSLTMKHGPLRAPATKAKVEIRRPSSSTAIKTFTCTSGTCTATVDSRQALHHYRFIYQDNADKVIKQSPWRAVTTTPTAVDTWKPTSESLSKWSAMTSYVLSPTTARIADIAAFTSRYIDHWYGSTAPMLSLVPASQTRSGRTYKQTLYVDLATITPSIVQNYMQQWTDYENALLHSNYDYDVARDSVAPVSGVQNEGLGGRNFWWYQMDMFDKAEQANGVVLFDSTTCVNGSTTSSTCDKTTAAYNSTTADVTLSDRMLIGYFQAFDEVNFVVSTAAAGATITYEYWNGTTWASFTPYLDTTDDTTSQRLEQSGKIRFTPPSNWARSAQSGAGTRSKYWIRVTRSGGTAPIFTQITGDTWWVPSMSAASVSQPRALWSYSYFSASDAASFTGLTFTFTTVLGSTSNISLWQYWNGTSWATLTTTSDTTNSMQNNGTVSWTPPGNWATLAYNGETTARYWVRYMRTSNGSSILTGSNNAAPPVTTAVALTGNASTALSTGTGRGWSSTDANRVNVGIEDLEYNPTPPTGQSARFRYQSRALHFWTVNYASPNFDYIRSGETVRLWSQILADMLMESIDATGVNIPGGFLDNGIVVPTLQKPAMPNNANTSGAGQMDHVNGATSNEDAYTDVRDAVQAIHPTWIVGQNGTIFSSGDINMGLVNRGDFAKEEGWFTFNVLSSGGLSIRDSTAAKGYWAALYDASAPGSPSNPLNTIVSVAYNDSQDVVGGCPDAMSTCATTDFVYGRWDRRNGAIYAWAAHLMAANANMRFSYVVDSITSYTTTIGATYVDRTDTTTYGTVKTALTTASTLVCSDAFVALPLSTFEVVIGEGREHLSLTKSSGQTDCVTKKVGGQAASLLESHDVGTQIYPVSTCLLGVQCNPPYVDVIRYGWVFPAMGIDVGVPAVGSTGTRAKYTTGITGMKDGLYRREYTDAWVLFSPGTRSTETKTSEYLSPGSSVLTFETAGMCSGSGCALYPLRVDGVTDNTVCNYTSIGGSDYRTADGGCTAIRPHPASWGAILMKGAVN